MNTAIKTADKAASLCNYDIRPLECYQTAAGYQQANLQRALLEYFSVELEDVLQGKFGCCF